MFTFIVLISSKESSQLIENEEQHSPQRVEVGGWIEQDSFASRFLHSHLVYPLSPTNQITSRSS